MKDYVALQQQRRAELFAAHQRTIDEYWDDHGIFCWPPNPDAHGGYRAILWHCLSYLAGEEHCVAKANRIVAANFNPAVCHFTPGAALDVLFHHEPRLTPEARGALERYITLNVPYMCTEDLKIYGYNDNHPYKAMHALIVGGERLDLPQYVERGLFKLRQAVELFERTGFPCEYNSPNYTPVSLNPLSCIVEQAQSEEARDLALRLEHFYWQDLAVHFDSRCGLPAGPYSRGYVNDYSGLLSGTLSLLSYLFPERFDFNLIEEVYTKGRDSALIDRSLSLSMPFYQVHPVWFASATYHLTEEIEAAIFAQPAGAYVRGTTESGAWPLNWKDEADRPEGAPAVHHAGPRRSLITTYFGEDYTLGTSQYAWLDNTQSHGFVATLNKGEQVRPEQAAIYYARMFYDEHSPYRECPEESSCFRDEGEIRTVQHEGTALVFYNPQPYSGRFQRLRTGLFRPLWFNRPEEIWLGEQRATTLNVISDELPPIAINEGSVYLGIIPLRLTDRGQSRRAHLQVHTYSDHLAILMSSFEGWGPQAFSYQEIMETCAGFVFEVQPASQFASFAAFRQWLAAGRVEDYYYSDVRTTTYQREGLTLSACYSPYQSAYRYASVNGAPLPVPNLSIEGTLNPGYGLVKGE
ncbi:MAG TPA: hypothetical protein VGM19_03855 [Armatimonadota bacterium]|jgi:hypothetical protein